METVAESGEPTPRVKRRPDMDMTFAAHDFAVRQTIVTAGSVFRSNMVVTGSCRSDF
jgi:hypothetical protein